MTSTATGVTRADVAASLRDAEQRVFWLDRADRPAPRPALTGPDSADGFDS